MDIKEATQIMNKNLDNDRKIYSCTEGKNYYTFMISDLKGNLIGDGACYAVKKSTKEFIKSIYMNLPDDLVFDPCIKEYSSLEIEKLTLSSIS